MIKTSNACPTDAPDAIASTIQKKGGEGRKQNKSLKSLSASPWRNTSRREK